MSLAILVNRWDTRSSVGRLGYIYVYRKVTDTVSNILLVVDNHAPTCLCKEAEQHRYMTTIQIAKVRRATWVLRTVPRR